MKTSETADLKRLLQTRVEAEKNKKLDTVKLRGAKLIEARAIQKGKVTAYENAIALVEQVENL